MKHLATCIVLVAFAGGVLQANAVEIRLLPEADGADPIIRLGHVAQLAGDDEQLVRQLAELPLFPAPGRGGQRVLRAAEVHELLRLNGLSDSGYRLVGARESVIRAARPPAAAPAPAPADDRRLTERQLQVLLIAHLQQQDASAEWKVQPEWTAGVAHELADASADELRVTAATRLSAHRWLFWLADAGQPDADPVSLAARVEQWPTVVVAVRHVERGQVVRPGDVQLQQVEQRVASGDALRRVEDVVGKQARRSIPAGQVLQETAVERPLLVRRRDLVTVTARAAGLAVSTTARAMDDGALGELIVVEAAFDERSRQREAYKARVTGRRAVEVYVAGAP